MRDNSAYKNISKEQKNACQIINNYAKWQKVSGNAIESFNRKPYYMRKENKK